MMHEFLANNRMELAQRCREKMALRPGCSATDQQLQNGVPMFLDQLIRTLLIEQTAMPMESRKISGPSGGGAALSEVGTSATLHGRDLMHLGYSVDQVVHDYGDLCQAITDLGFERDAPFNVDEFRTLNRCLDNAIADAVTEFGFQHDTQFAENQAKETNEKLGFFVHELRNSLNNATLAFVATKEGNLPLSGATGTVLERSLDRLRVLIDRSLVDIRSAGENSSPSSEFSVATFIDEIATAGKLAAKVRGCAFIVSAVDSDLAICGNRELLFSSVWNLLQNAFKFTRAHTKVSLNAYASGDRILIEVRDHCGSLAPGSAERMFIPFEQHGKDKTGLGLGLSIARQCVMENNGTLTALDIPEVGCVFTVNLPRYQLR